MAGVAGTISRRLLLTWHGWSHRRSGRGLEGSWHLCGLRTQRRVARRGRPRHEERGGQVPAAAGPAREVGRLVEHATLRDCVANRDTADGRIMTCLLYTCSSP